LDWVAHTAIKRALDARSIGRDRKSELAGFAYRAVGAVVTIFGTCNTSFIFIDLDIFIEKISNST
jgi:hypothetical protein